MGNFLVFLCFLYFFNKDFYNEKSLDCGKKWLFFKILGKYFNVF